MKVWRFLGACIALTVLSLSATAQQRIVEEINQGTVGVIAGGIDGTSMRAASDLASVLDRGNELRVLPIQGKGSVQAITDILFLRGIDIGIVQSDALAFAQREQNPDLPALIHYITRLYNEEFHILARDDIQTIVDLRGKRVNVGRPGSGTEMTANIVLDALNIDVERTAFDHSLALEKLRNAEIDALLYVVGKPARLFESIGADEGLRLIPVDYTPELLDTYLPSRFTGEDYPGLLGSGAQVDTLAVGAVMAVYNWDSESYRHTKVSRFIDAFFRELPALQQAPRHPKWREVNLTAQLPGWNRFPPADEWLKQAIVANRSPLRNQFEEFVSESTELASAPTEVRDSLFEEFIQWQNSRDLTFALVPKAVNSPFFDLARDGCKQAESDLEAVECLYIGPGEHTEQEQAQIVQDLIDRGIDGIAVSPSNAPLMAAVLQRAEAANIPVVTWDSDLLAEDAPLRQAYVGTDNYQIGVSLAELTKALKPEGGSICIQSGGAEAANLNERMQGIRDTLAGAQSAAAPGARLEGQGGWTEIADCPLFTNDDAAVAVQQMGEILGANPDLDAFVPTGGWPQFVPGAYRQIVSPYQDRIASGDLAIVVADTLPMQMDLLGEGLSLGQVGQRPYEMGYRAMLLLKDLLEGKPVDEAVFTGLDVCTPDNLDSCLSG